MASRMGLIRESPQRNGLLRVKPLPSHQNSKLVTDSAAHYKIAAGREP